MPASGFQLTTSDFQLPTKFTLANLAAYLLEQQSNDAMVIWNIVNSTLVFDPLLYKTYFFLTFAAVKRTQYF
jgi:hypothetical protein